MNIPRKSLKWYKMSAGSLSMALLLLVVLRVPITNLLKQYGGVSNPESWLDKGVIALSLLLLLSAERWLRLECPRFLRRFLESANMDWGEFCAKLDAVSEGVCALDVRVQDMDTRFTRDFLAIRADVGEVEGKMRQQEETDKTGQSDRATLLLIRMNKITFLKKLSPELAAYAILKANSFIDFVTGIHALGFYITEDTVRRNNPNMDFSRIADDITCEIGKMRKVGLEFLPNAYLQIFFAKHETNVVEYTRQVKNIIEDKTNYKHRRFQETSEEFLSNFLEAMHHSYIDYIKSGEK